MTDFKHDQDVESGQGPDGMDRRLFLKSAAVGASGLAAASTGLLAGSSVRALAAPPGGDTPGLNPPGAAALGRLPNYGGPWNKIHANPFGGFDFALGYIAEGVDMGDPLQDVPNPSGLFESANPAIPSAVGGNETAARSAEFWYRDILNWSNEDIANDHWSAINYMRRLFGLDLDDPNTDGYPLPSGPFSYGGSPDPNDEISLFSPRIAVDGKGGWVRMAPTLLAPSVGYTVVFRAGRAHPNYSGGTTAMSPDDIAKVRDGGIWGGTGESMDVLGIIQDAAAGNRTYTTPNGPSSNPAAWGQFWRRVAPIDGVDVDALDPNSPVGSRPTPRPNWPVGYLPAGTDYFWGNYNLLFGAGEETVTLHYQSEIPTRFRDIDGIPEAFLCEMTANPGGTDMPQSQIDQGFKDVDGSLSGFPDLNDPALDGQNPFGLGRIHGTSIPRGINAEGRTTFHLRNWLLFPPRLNAANSINDTVPGKGILDFD